MDRPASAVATRWPTRLVVWLLILGGLGGAGVIAVQFEAPWAPRGWWDLPLTRPAAYIG